MGDIRDLLKETLIAAGLSPERSARYFDGITARQIRRWIKKESDPQLLQRKIIERAIKEIDKDLEKIRKPGAAYWTEELAGPPEIPKKEKEFSDKIKVFYDALMKKAHSSERVCIANCISDFSEILYLARKHKEFLRSH